MKNLNLQESVDLNDIDSLVSTEVFENTEFIEYEPLEIDEFLVFVNDPEDWEEVHNYIVNENEIDGIPNRKINCTNTQEYSLRSSVYEMSIDEANILKTHPKVEDVVLNSEKYPQPNSLCSLRHKKNIAIGKPIITALRGSSFYSTNSTNGVRGNWSHLFVNDPTGNPFNGVGIVTTSTVDTDITYSLDGFGVDSVIIDSGVSYLHPEFLNNDGTTRVKDVILDGPYKVDPEYFITNNLTYNKVVDGIDVGVGIATTAALEWWGNSSKRSSKFSSLGTFSIHPSYSLSHVATKTTNPSNDQLIDGHGTACASQIGGKSYGLAFGCNIWNIRIMLGGAGGYISGDGALNVCAIFHKAKIISQNGNPDPTLINNSWGQTSSTSNTNGSFYTHYYRGSTTFYIGNGSNLTPPANAGACRNHTYFTYNDGISAFISGYSAVGQYTPVSYGVYSSSAAQNAISAGCVVVAAAGNQNQKFSDKNDLDYNNAYLSSTNYINRCGGVQKGFSGDDERNKGTIRVGALDCAVEPFNSKQGTTSYSVRRVCYSNSGPMINVWSPGEMTMAAGYTTNYEDYIRSDDSDFYDTYFNGTSAACPNACSVIALYLQTNRSASQSDVRGWLDTRGSVNIDLSDQQPDPNGSGYWSNAYSSSTDLPVNSGQSYNLMGNGSLRGSVKNVLFNPFNKGNIKPFITGVEMSGVLFSQS